MGKVIGIDLGTTNSLAACFRNGAAEIIPVGEGARVMVPAESISGRRYFLA